MGKVIGLTYDLKSDWVLGPGDPPDMNAEFDKPETVDKVVAALEAGGNHVVRIGNVHRLLEMIDSLEVDLVFNICEGQYGRNRESQVPVLLELKGIPFVGSDALTLGLTLDKVFAKKIFVADGIPTPRFFEAGLKTDLEQRNTIGFPLIVKTRFEGTSKGLSLLSRVEDLEGLRQQVDMINTEYQQPALVEEFIPGREFTVAVVGNNPPQGMPVVQVSIDGSTDLGDKFYTFDRVTSDALRYVCPADISSALAQQMQELALKVYTCVECRDLGRVDFRVDAQGNPYVLEINPLPYLGKEDVFNIFPQVIGTTYEEIINRVVMSAVSRYGIEKNAIAYEQPLPN